MGCIDAELPRGGNATGIAGAHNSTTMSSLPPDSGYCDLDPSVPQDAGYMEIDPGSVREMPATERVHVTTEEDGSHYKGEVDTDGDKTGEGTYVWADGSMYVGQWKKNKFHGIGTLSYADGGEYCGEWRNDRKHGHGRMCFANADVYEGDWKNGVMHGYGEILFADGREYKGQHRDGKKHGRGTFIFASGRVWYGEFRNGKQYQLIKQTAAPPQPQEQAPAFSTLV